VIGLKPPPIVQRPNDIGERRMRKTMKNAQDFCEEYAKWIADRAFYLAMSDGANYHDSCRLQLNQRRR